MVVVLNMDRGTEEKTERLKVKRKVRSYYIDRT